MDVINMNEVDAPKTSSTEAMTYSRKITGAFGANGAGVGTLLAA
jgi:hypothetical protein